MSVFYPISMPSIGSKERTCVLDAVDSGWISSIGKYIEEFEKRFAVFCGTKHALAVSNGTTGLHLALVTLDVGPKHEVIVPDLTFVATANAVAYTGAKVVPVDIERDTLCIDPAAIERAITARTKGIIPVHLYGQPARMDAIREIASRRGLFVIEDAAEAHGAEIGSRRVGSMSDWGVFSFYGNKVITTGEGGMLTTDNSDLYARAKRLRDHAMSPTKRYWHTEVGYNYRMTNLQAALGVAQMDRIDEFIEKRRQIMNWYREDLQGTSGLRLNQDHLGSKSVYWMVCAEFDGLTEKRRDELMKSLHAKGVDSRPYFYPVSDLPMFERADTPVTHDVFPTGINLPSYFDLDRDGVTYICRMLSTTLQELGLSSRPGS